MSPAAGETNWSRWGADDERGAVNLVDAEAVQRAVAEVRTGRRFELGIRLDSKGPVFPGRVAPLHFMTVDGGDYLALGRDTGYGDDVLITYTQGTSHLDGLAHVWKDGTVYNGYPISEIRSSGAAVCGVDKIGSFVTRAHLMSFVDRPTEAAGLIGAVDLDRVVTERSVAIHPGDALLLHTGWMERWYATGRADPDTPVLDVTGAEWIARHDVALVGADNEAVERAGEDDVHMRLIRELGVYLCELLTLAEPVTAGVTTGMLVLAPLRIGRGTGSPVNPVLIC